MLAIAAGAVIVAGGSAAYSTDTRPSEDRSSDALPSSPLVKLDSAVFQIPHPEKKHKGGEDTFLISSSGAVLGVFDGVGGWADSGVDPRDYAVKLSEGAQEATDVKHMDNPVDVMRYAADYAKKTVGSSTACIVNLKDSTLTSANLGDSGFMLVRITSNNMKDIQYYKTKEQQFSFNFPYQLGTRSRNRAEDSDVASIPVQPNDIIILGTDGLFDNLDDARIIKIVYDNVMASSLDTLNVTSLSRAIANEAFKVSQDPEAVTPFTIGSNYRYRGGKPDDITVLVSRVAPASTSNNTPSQSTSSGQNSARDTTNGNSPVQFKRVSISNLFDSEIQDSDELHEEEPSFFQRLLQPWIRIPAKL